MIDQPLQPFAPPQGFGDLGVPASGPLIEWFLYLALAFWATYTLVAVYHWVKYSHAARVAIPAIALHVFVSFILIAYTLSGAIFI